MFSLFSLVLFFRISYFLKTLLKNSLPLNINLNVFKPCKSPLHNYNQIVVKNTF